MLLKVENLVVRYGSLTAVKGVSFGISAGESLGVIGESGCGKSSLAKAIVKLNPASEGRILYKGEDISLFNRAQTAVYRRGVQMIFQDAAGSLNPRMTVRSILNEVIRVHGSTRRIDELLEAVGLPVHTADSYARELSGGQCQRVSIARCLALGPDVIVADEPVSALDVSVQARILNLLRELQRRFNLGLILISHDLAVVRTVCDSAVVMYEGEIVERGSPVEMFRDPKHDYTRRLVEAVPDVRRIDGGA